MVRVEQEPVEVTIDGQPDEMRTVFVVLDQPRLALYGADLRFLKSCGVDSFRADKRRR